MITPSVFSRNLHLRGFIDSDLALVYKGLSDPEVIKYYGVSYKTLEDTLEQMEFFRNLESNATGRWWAVTDINTGKFFGAVGFNNYNRKTGTAELGFWLLPEFQGCGIMSEALKMAEKHGFGILGIKTIEAYVETENEPSKKLLEKHQYAWDENNYITEVMDNRTVLLMKYFKTRDSL